MEVSLSCCSAVLCVVQHGCLQKGSDHYGVQVEKLVNSQTFPFLRLPNLCPRGRVVAVSDESFHSAKHLLHESFPPFTPHSFKRGLGQMYRGWETSV